MMPPALALALLSVVSAGISPSLSVSERTLRAEPAAVEVGEPFSLVLEVLHAAETSGTELTSAELTLDESWHVLATRFSLAGSDPTAPGRRVSRRIWEVVSLEPGAREIVVHGLVPLSDDDPGEARVTVDVAGLLAAGEDAPRPLRGFPPSFGQDPGAEPLLPWVRTAAILGVLFASVPWFLAARAWRRSRHRRRRDGEATVDPLARLETLQHEGTAEPRRLREGHYELSRLLRGAIDHHLARDRSGLTDEEWLAEIEGDPSVHEELLGALGPSLRACAGVKYAGVRPSSFAVEETFTGARRVFETLAATRNGKEGAS